MERERRGQDALHLVPNLRNLQSDNNQLTVLIIYLLTKYSNCIVEVGSLNFQGLREIINKKQAALRTLNLYPLKFYDVLSVVGRLKNMVNSSIKMEGL